MRRDLNVWQLYCSIKQRQMSTLVQCFWTPCTQMNPMNNISKTIAHLTLLAVIFCSANTFADTKPSLAKPIKLGVSTGGDTVATLKAGWYYSWYIDPKEGVTAEFVPMIKHGKDAGGWYFDHIAKHKDAGFTTSLLGFNEPERKDQGDTTVEQAIASWPKLMKTGLRLGSPAVSSDAGGKKWFEQFMKEAEDKKLKVDFVTVHWYGDISEPNAEKQFEVYLTDLHKKYHRPIWITEFAGFNWKHCKHPVTMKTNVQFLSQVQPWLEKTDFIERYCWFSNKGEADLFADRKKLELSELGQVYRDGGAKGR